MDSTASEDKEPAATIENLLTFDDRGLIVAVIQDYQTGQVLMVGYMNRESLARTLRDRRACFWSRSRRKLWVKGETSGHFLIVKEVRMDCDGDALLVKCDPIGPTCHTNETSCFYRVVEADGTVRPDSAQPKEQHIS